MSDTRRRPPNRPIGRGANGSPRRRTISPLGFDLVLALSQAPRELRLAELARTIGSPVSSVQTALRILVTDGLVSRVDDHPPRYLLAPDHPAASELAALATVLPEPERAISIVLRANPAVTYACVDEAGFIVALDESDHAATAALDRQLGLVAGARPATPNVLRMSAAEFGRMLRVSIGVRARVEAAVVLRESAGGAPAYRAARRTAH